MTWLAHSPRPKRGIPAQPYAAHLKNVEARALLALESMLACSSHREQVVPDRLRAALRWAVMFHDLGKLEDGNQAVLRSDTGQGLPYLHESAGALHCYEQGQIAAAFAIHSHHQGLTNQSTERAQFERGCVNKSEPCSPFVRDGQIAQTEKLLPLLLARHAQANLSQQAPPEPRVEVMRWVLSKGRKRSHLSALEMRLLLSLLADADHGDTAHHYGQEISAVPAEPRWPERLKSLENHISKLGGKSGRRDFFRQTVYQECFGCDPAVPIYACDAPVGSGKTTAVMAYLLRAAIQLGLRRVFVVLPFTNIIQQSVDVYRKALVLDGEDPEQIVAENHHVAEFESGEARYLTTLWRAPIVVTTAVQFFETLASCSTRRLRKLHMLPGSAVFVDEAHAAIPMHLWPSMWDRITELTTNWSCRFVLGSGSLPRFWENVRLFPSHRFPPPPMLKAETIIAGAAGERNRVSFHTETKPQNLASLVQWLKTLSGARLIVMNTVQSAAVLAAALRQEGVVTLHLSTALTPAHRERVLRKAKEWLDSERRSCAGWVMVATSCIEAGVDLSFDIALRECSSVASLIQISGRVNREGDPTRGEVWNFTATAKDGLTANPSLRDSRTVVDCAFSTGLLDRMAGDAMTVATTEELKRSLITEKVEPLLNAEEGWEFSTVADLSRVIEDDTVTAVVEPVLIARLVAGDRVRHTQLVRGSVSIRKAVAARAGLCKLESMRDDRLYIWPEGQYDDELLGIMKYLLLLNRMSNESLAMI